MDRVTVVGDMYQGYLDAHDELVAGTLPSNIPSLAGFSARMDETTSFRVQALDLDLLGREAIERFMVESRQATGYREVSERVVEHGDLVVSFNHATVGGPAGDATLPLVAVFQFDGDRIAGFWGFAG